MAHLQCDLLAEDEPAVGNNGNVILVCLKMAGSIYVGSLQLFLLIEEGVGAVYLFTLVVWTQPISRSTSRPQLALPIISYFLVVSEALLVRLLENTVFEVPIFIRFASLRERRR